jgi:hypothetical protein
MAVGTSSSQSLRVQVGTRYRDQDPGSASSLGRCLLALGMYDLTHPAAPLILCRAARLARQSIPRVGELRPARTHGASWLRRRV